MSLRNRLILGGAAVAVALGGCADDDGLTEPVSELAEHPPEGRTCAADEVLAAQIAADPDRALRLESIDQHAQRYQLVSHQALAGVATIPVVVHIVYRTAAENVSDAQIQSQIDVMNADFRRTNSDADGTWPQAADSEIQFCWVGTTRTQTSVTSHGTNDSIKFTSQGGRDVFEPQNYLNMWVGNIGGGILGYAQFPGGPSATDGVVMDYRYFGTIGTATPPFHLGRTTTHEIGHYLNLRHIWGDGGCGVDDFVSDTPTSDAANFGCATGHVSCSSVDMVQNYMDYSDDACMNLFSQGQANRMRALFDAGGARSGMDVGGGTACTPVDPGNPPPPDPCTDTEIELRLQFDDYPGETSWEVRDSGGALVASGSGYSGAGSTVTELVCVADGSYELTVFDSYGDGMCCGYGNGSYELTNGATVLASGGAFGSSETTPFTIGGGPPTNDPPTASFTSSTSGLTVTVDGGGSSDSDGSIASYSWDFGDGATDTGATASHGYGAAGTYTVTLTVTDDDGATDTATANVTVTAGGSVVLVDSDFESGLQGWTDGGSDCRRSSRDSAYANSGIYTMRIRDNSGAASSFYRTGMDLSGYSQLTIEFSFYARSMETNEDFFVEVFDGSSWNVVATYARNGAGFSNNTRYDESVTVSSSSVTFGSNAGIRFRCDASGNSDYVYIDDVVVSAQ